MATRAHDLTELDLTSSRRTLVLVWQNPTTRRFLKVGQLDALPGNRLVFHYLPTAGDDPAFQPLLEFPDLNAAYVSDEVPAFFANRILSADRPGYDDYLRWLGIEDANLADVPFEVLARTGGGRVTDTFHVVDFPLDLADSFQSRFFVSGVRYVDGSGAVIAALTDGVPLELALDESNPQNPKAVLVNAQQGGTIGYVPDWLCADVHGRIQSGWEVAAVAERVNPGAPAHVRVLCRLEARRSQSPD